MGLDMYLKASNWIVDFAFSPPEERDADLCLVEWTKRWGIEEKTEDSAKED